MYSRCIYIYTTQDTVKVIYRGYDQPTILCNTYSTTVGRSIANIYDPRRHVY